MNVTAENNICLIGGTGFLGSSFRWLYNHAFTKILIFGRKAATMDLRPNECYFSIQHMEVDEIVAVLQQEKVTTVIDFAYNSIPKTSFENPVEDFSNNLLLVNKHLEIMRKLKTCRYIYISSGGTIYGDVGNGLINELHQNFPLSPYGITKMACERYVNMYHYVYDLDVVIVRPANIYGPGQIPFRGQGFIATAMASAHISRSMTVYGDGSNIRDYIYIDDFCTALSDILTYGTNGEIYNIGTSKGRSLNEIILRIGEVIGKANKDLQVDYLPQRRFDVHYNVLDNTKLAGLNNWKDETGLQAGLEKTWMWILQYMAI